MTLKTLGPMLGELNAMLQAKGCKVTEVSVTLQPLEDDGVYTSGDIRLALAPIPQRRPISQARPR